MWRDWVIYWTLGNFSKPVATIILPKSTTFLGNFCKGVKSFNFSSEITFGQLYRHLAIFYRSHCLQVENYFETRGKLKVEEANNGPWKQKYIWFGWYYSHPSDLWLLLGSPMLMDTHLSQQNAGSQHKVLWLLQEVTRPKSRFKHPLPETSEVDVGANRCQHILVGCFTCTWLFYVEKLSTTDSK